MVYPLRQVSTKSKYRGVIQTKRSHEGFVTGHLLRIGNIGVGTEDTTHVPASPKPQWTSKNIQRTSLIIIESRLFGFSTDAVGSLMNPAG
jgi:hypothetical protein